MTGFPSPPQQPIVIVTAGGRNPDILINALNSAFGNVVVLVEPAESKLTFVKRRARKLGMITSAGQLATMVVSRFGKRFTEKRAAEIIESYHVDHRHDGSLRRIALPSINTPEAIASVKALTPSVVFLVSCRILSASTLSQFTCPVINFHAGINPQYRGLMGGYWARIQRDEANFGTTVHLVDAGIDTGGILYQQRLTPSKDDTLHTYPLLQTAGATGIAVQAVADALDGRLAPQPAIGPSRQWYHPPIWTWIWNGITRGIW